MCGRYALIPDAKAWAHAGENLSPDMESVLAMLRSTHAHYNVSPTQVMPIIVDYAETQRPEIYPARWGFIPSWWNKPGRPGRTFNARRENCASGPMWRGSWQHKRCLVPASYWYEWSQAAGQRVPWAFRPRDDTEMMLAGIWDEWTDPVTDELVISFAIITQPAVSALAEIHHRMPIVLAPQVWESWISRRICTLREIDTELTRSELTEIRTYRLKRTVNNSRNDGPECLEPDPER